MKPCPACGCKLQRLAYAIDPAGTTVALACYNKACDYTGPYTGPITFPPNRQDTDRAALAWDAEIVRRRLPARLAKRLPAPRYVNSDYVKPATARMH